MMMFTQTVKTKTESDKFLLIYEKYRNLLFYISKDILKDAYLAEDAVQDAFVIISKNLDKINDPLSAETKRFISVITRNVSINLLNKSRREEPVEDISNEYYYVSNYHDSSHDEYFAKYRLEEVVVAIKKLPATLRDPLLLYVAHEMSTSEIADVLGISLAAVQKRIQRARKSIMTELSKNGDD